MCAVHTPQLSEPVILQMNLMSQSNVPMCSDNRGCTLLSYLQMILCGLDLE